MVQPTPTMTTLKHLAMAVMAFLLTTAGFLTFLREVLPPSQVLAAASAAGAITANPMSGSSAGSSEGKRQTASAAGSVGERAPDQTGSPVANGAAGMLGLPSGIDVGKVRDLLDGVDPDTIQSALRHLEAVKAGAAEQGDNEQATVPPATRR
jgi:hypothetical protein